MSDQPHQGTQERAEPQNEHGPTTVKGIVNTHGHVELSSYNPQNFSRLDHPRLDEPSSRKELLQSCGLTDADCARVLTGFRDDQAQFRGWVFKEEHANRILDAIAPYEKNALEEALCERVKMSCRKEPWSGDEDQEGGIFMKQDYYMDVSKKAETEITKYYAQLQKDFPEFQAPEFPAPIPKEDIVYIEELDYDYDRYENSREEPKESHRAYDELLWLERNVITSQENIVVNIEEFHEAGDRFRAYAADIRAGNEERSKAEALYKDQGDTAAERHYVKFAAWDQLSPTRYIREHSSKVEDIVNTHGHVDTRHDLTGKFTLLDHPRLDDPARRTQLLQSCGLTEADCARGLTGFRGNQPEISGWVFSEKDANKILDSIAPYKAAEDRFTFKGDALEATFFKRLELSKGTSSMEAGLFVIKVREVYPEASIKSVLELQKAAQEHMRSPSYTTENKCEEVSRELYGKANSAHFAEKNKQKDGVSLKTR